MSTISKKIAERNDVLLDAVWELMRDYASTKARSKTSYVRVCKAIDKIGIGADGKKTLLCRLHYHDRLNEPYKWLRSQLAKEQSR